MSRSEVAHAHLAWVGVILALLLPRPAAAQEHESEESHTHDEGLHFSHPLIAESVTPDTKVRLDYQLFDFEAEGTEHNGGLEAEYAFARWFSIEAGLPYNFTDSGVGNLEIALKFANFAAEGAGFLLGYGVEVGFPTGSGSSEEELHEEPSASRRRPSHDFAGSARLLASSSGGGGGDEWELAPFLNVGFQRGRWELVAWGIVGIPFGQEPNEEGETEAETEINYNLSVLFKFSPRLQGLLELAGSGGISGDAVGEDVAFVAPGLKVAPFAGQPLFLGTAVGFPITTSKAFDTTLKVSAFWHF